MYSVDIENPFSDLAKKHSDFISYIVAKLQDHEQRLDEIVIAADMLSSKTARKAQEHESRLDALKEQLRIHGDKLSAGRAPSALKQSIAGSLKKEVKVRLNSQAEDLEISPRPSPRPSPEQAELGDSIIDNREETTRQMLQGADARQSPKAQCTSEGSIDTVDLPDTLKEAIENTGNSRGSNARSRRTCMIPKIEDMIDEKDETEEVPVVDSAPHLSDPTPQPDTTPPANRERIASASVASALAAAKSTCIEQGSDSPSRRRVDESPSRQRGDESPTRRNDESPPSSPRNRGRAQTDQLVDLESYSLGQYVITTMVIVTDGLQSKNIVSRLNQKDVVNVLKVDLDNRHRVRAEIEEPKGWVNIRDGATDQTYAEKAHLCSKCKAYKNKGTTEADGEWCCVDCRGHNRSTRRLNQRKCDQCEQTCVATLGCIDSTGSWYCNKCWDAWK